VYNKLTSAVTSVRFVKSSEVEALKAPIGWGMAWENLGRWPRKFFIFFSFQNSAFLVHFRILILKFYLPSNAGKGTKET